MFDIASIDEKRWFLFLDEEGQNLVRLTYQLLMRERRLKSSYRDYGFVVFPMAKAFEGFLKKFFYQTQMISHEQYEHRNFRIGRSLNPDLSMRNKDEAWVFDDVERLCSTQLARRFWNTWLKSRNHLFHYFPDMRYDISLTEAEGLITEMAGTMYEALGCILKDKNKEE